MAYSYVTYTGTGSQKLFTVTFPYIAKTHVSVLVDTVATTFTWNTDSIISIDPAPALDSTVIILRTTPLDKAVINFTNGARLSEADLDLLVAQYLYSLQEDIESRDDRVLDLADLYTRLGAVETTLSRTGRATGDLLVNGAAAWESIAAGANGYVLTSNGAGAKPTYQEVVTDGSIGAAKLADYAVGDYVIAQSREKDSTLATSYTTLKSIQVDRPGALTVSFTLSTKSASHNAFGRLYRTRGGVSTAIGIPRSTISTSGDTYTEDLTGFQAGDIIELKVCSSNASNYAYVEAFQVCASEPFGMVVLTGAH